MQHTPSREMNLSLDSSELYKRRLEHLGNIMRDLASPSPDAKPTTVSDDDVFDPSSARSEASRNRTAVLDSVTSEMSNLELMFCRRCEGGFRPYEKMVNTSGQLWHPECFVCAQCFQPFPGGMYYEFEGRNYCEHDYGVLFMPRCGGCSEGIGEGRVIRALGRSWHATCLSCHRCRAPLADEGFLCLHKRPFCKKCYHLIQEEYRGKLVCSDCCEVIDTAPLRFRDEVFHFYHFHCKTCGVELSSGGREVDGEVHCIKCHDQMDIPVCAACRRPIEEQRIITALRKRWHVEHFVCRHCEKPFNGRKYYEKDGHAYCETHYEQLFGDVCFVCNRPSATGYKSLNKMWCPAHFWCSCCDRPLNKKSRFFDIDLRPVCRKCYEKFPAELKKRLRKDSEQNPFMAR